MNPGKRKKNCSAHTHPTEYKNRIDRKEYTSANRILSLWSANFFLDIPEIMNVNSA